MWIQTVKGIKGKTSVINFNAVFLAVPGVFGEKITLVMTKALKLNLKLEIIRELDPVLKIPKEVIVPQISTPFQSYQLSKKKIIANIKVILSLRLLSLTSTRLKCARTGICLENANSVTMYFPFFISLVFVCSWPKRTNEQNWCPQ